MAGKRRGAAAPRGAARRGVALRAQAATRETRQNPRATRSRSQAKQDAVPTVYREMLAEAGVVAGSPTDDAPERPLKRPRTGRRPPALEAAPVRAPPCQDGGDNDNAPSQASKTHRHMAQAPGQAADGSDDAQDDMDFVDVVIPEPNVQTLELSSASESEAEDDEMEFEDVDIDAIASKQQEPAGAETGTIQLNLTATEQALAPAKRNRKQPLTKDEKQHRVEIHQMHLLCLLAHVEKRNHWCNDPVVQETLRPLLSHKIIRFLNPPAKMNQFGQTESLKRGLKDAQDVFRHKFRITETGLRRALWAEDKADLQHYARPRNGENCLDKVDFRKAAQQLKGSRDVAAQLFCALLRAVGVEARLVCSLQPLSFVPGGPTLAKPRQDNPPSKQPSQVPRSAHAASAPAIPSPRARLGHPQAAAYRMPHIPAPPPSTSVSVSGPGLVLDESPFPVYWSEVLDMGHQKWQPVDAIVTGQHFRPHRLEPPALDRNNILTYVVAFDDDGTAKDVTRRYAKAINSKTRRLRIDGPLVASSVEGAKWWRKALRRYRLSRIGPLNDLDQIEESELTAAEAREPMPRNVADFKDHPVYALERHLRRHEVLIPSAQPIGTVGAGSKGPLEKIFRRKDVRLARTREKWYRLGRVIKSGQEPVKVVPKRKPAISRNRLRLQARRPEGADASSSDDDAEHDPVLGHNPLEHNPLYTFDQTELYVPSPVVGGRIPKNVFGNIEVYVPSMVPPGGFHIKHHRAAHAAYILGVDYAPALQGFEFQGRKGTAVYKGAIVPVEAVEAVRVVLKGLEDLEEELERQKRRLTVLEKWTDWMRTLRIRKRVFWDAKEDVGGQWGGLELSQFVREGEEVGNEEMAESGEDEDEDVPRGYGAVGGAVLNDEDGGGGFEPEPGGFEPGGFEPGGFEPGGFEPGGFEPGGFEPGGFELDTGSGGFEPGGFVTDNIVEPGGFEASHNHQPEPSYSFSGGFEVESRDEGSETRRIDGESRTRNGDDMEGTSREVRWMEQETSGQDEAHDSFNMEDLEEKDEGLSMESEQQQQQEQKQKQKQDQEEEGEEEKAKDVDILMKDAPVTLPKPPASSQENPGNGKDIKVAAMEQKGEVEEEDEEEDGGSETTEELFMDEDGALLE